MTSNNDTKERILETACRLFATSGFHGASIRDIANEAGVNLAAVNYHFGNKDGLLAEILIQAKTLFNVEVDALQSENLPPLEMAMRIFAIFRSHAHEFRNGFTIFLSDNNQDIIEKVYQNDIGNAGRPPGYETMFQALKQNIPNLGDFACSWAANTILAYMVHSSLFFAVKPKLSHPCLSSDSVCLDKFEGFMLLEVEEMITSILNRLETEHEKIEEKLRLFMNP